MSRRSRSAGLAPALCALSFLSVSAVPEAGALQGPPPTPVRAIRVPERMVQQREAVTGSLRAAFDAVLPAREEGAVLEIRAREGRFVKEGETLVILDTKRLEAERMSLVAMAAEAEASTAMAQAALEDAEADLEALEAAGKARRDSVSVRELRRARTLSVSSRAAFAAAKQRQEALGAQLELMDLRIRDATLRAPFDGTVVMRHVELGEWVMPGAELLTLVSTGQLEIWLDVPERLLAKTAELEAAFDVKVGAAGRQVTATEPRSVPQVNGSTRTFPLIGTIDGDAALGLSPGMSASAWIPVGTAAPTLMVPKDALVYRPAGVAVMTVAGGEPGGDSVSGTASMVPVRILFETEEEVAVEASDGGLGAGGIVIVEGNERLFPGTPVSASVTDAHPGEVPAPKGDQGEGQ